MMENDIEHESAIENIRAVNEDDKGTKIEVTENNSNEDEVRKNHTEAGMVEQISGDVTASVENKLNARNNDVPAEAGDTQDDIALKTSNKSELDENMLETVDDPPDSFFDGLLDEDFLDSLAVVDAWNPDADESCGSDAAEQTENKTRREESGRESLPLSESKRKDREESVSKNSVTKSGREYRDHRGGRDSCSRNDSRRHARTSAEMKRDSRERNEGTTGRKREKVGADDNVRAAQRRHQHERDRSRERHAARRERDSRDNDRKSPYRRVKDSKDSTERNIHRRNRKSREKDTEKNTHDGGNSSSRENKDKSVEGSVQKDDKDRVHRYSHQVRVSDRARTSDRHGNERKSNLQDLCLDRKDGVPQNLEDISRREDITKESLRKEKNSDINLANKEVQMGSAYRAHDKEKELSHGASDMPEEETGDQSHVVTKPNNPLLNVTKLDTCIKELDDLVPPGTESDFILPAKNEASEFKKEKNIMVKEGPGFEIVNDKDVLFADRKSSRHPVIKTESSKNEINVASKTDVKHKILEGVKSEKTLSSNTSQQLREEGEIVDSSHERKRRYTGSSRSLWGKSSISGSKRKRDNFDEDRKRKSRNSSSKERKRKSTSLEKEFGASRVKSEQDTTVMNRVYDSVRGENSSRSRSREKWQCNRDPHRLKGRKDDQSDTRQSWSGSRGKKRELSIGRERMVGSREENRKASSAERWQTDIDTQKPKRQSDVCNESRRQVRSVSMDKECDSFLPTRTLRSHSREKEYSSRSSKYRDRQGRRRRSVSQEVENKRSSLKSRQSSSWDKNKHRNLSPISAGHVSVSPSSSFEMSPSPLDREWRHLSRSLSRERRSRGYRSYHDNFSPDNRRPVFSPSDSCVSLSLSDEPYNRRQPRRKRSPFWKEIERKLAKDLGGSTYNQSTVYPLPSAVGPTQHEVYNPSSYPAPDTVTPAPAPFLPVPGTVPPAHLPYSPDHSRYSHGYPSHIGFSDAVVQPPPPEHHIPTPFGSAPSVNLPVPPVMPPQHIPLPVPPPVYNMPPPPHSLEFADQTAPFSVNAEFPSFENVFSQPLHGTEKSEDPPQVPPPPRISQSCDVKKMSLSSLLEASAKGTLSSRDVLASTDLADEFKVGGSAKWKQKSVDPLLVVRCEEAIRTLEANDDIIVVGPGHLVWQDLPKPHLLAATTAQVLDDGTFQSPILRRPDLQLSFTSVPVRDEVLAECSYDFLKSDTKSVQGLSCSEPLAPCVVTSHTPNSAENFKVYVDSSTMTDIHGDYMTVLKKTLSKSQSCASCTERSKKIMVWNSTQTLVGVHDKIMVWNHTQTPRISVENVGVQVEMVQIGALHKFGARKRHPYSRRAVKKGGNVKSASVREEVNKRGSAYHSNVSKNSTSGPTAALKEDVNKEVTESRQQSPRRSHLSTSSNSECGRRDRDTSCRTSSHEIYGRSLFSASSSGRSDVERTLSSPACDPPKGILKTRMYEELQPPPLPLPHLSSQESSLKGCDLPRYSVTSALQTSKPYSPPGSLREMGSSPSLYTMRRPNLFGEMDSSSMVQRSVVSTGSVVPRGTAASFPSFGSPDIRVTLSRSQDVQDFHRDQLSPSLRRSVSPGAGFRMQPFQQQSSRAFHHTDDPSMIPYDADTHY